MNFKIIHKNGKEKIISANNLDEAEKKADSIWKDWTDIYEIRNNINNLILKDKIDVQIDKIIKIRKGTK